MKHMVVIGGIIATVISVVMVSSLLSSQDNSKNDKLKEIESTEPLPRSTGQEYQY